MNSSGKSVGRPKKKSFKTKSASTIQDLDSINSVSQEYSGSVQKYVRNPPIGLLNGCNICFINCAIQVFYYISAVSDRLHFCLSNGLKSPIVMALADLFNKMSSSVSPVNTPNYFQSLKGKFNWILGQQQDSNEFLINVLQDLYAKKKVMVVLVI